MLISLVEILRQNAAGLKNITSYQGDAADLGLFADNSFDAVLVLGPMYHLFEKAEKPVQKIALAGTDSVLALAEKAQGMHLSDEDFCLFFEYHLKTCEKRELLGTQTHLLYIYRKR